MGRIEVGLSLLRVATERVKNNFRACIAPAVVRVQATLMSNKSTQEMKQFVVIAIVFLQPSFVSEG